MPLQVSRIAGTVLAVLAVLVAWDAVFVAMNFMVSAANVRSLVEKLDPWFMRPFVEFATSVYGWMATAIANAAVFVALFVVSLAYDLTEVEW